jgi:hypothetical protein
LAFVARSSSLRGTEVKKMSVQVLLTCLFSNSPTTTTSAYAPVATSPHLARAANDPLLLATAPANDAARRRQTRRAALRTAAWVVGVALMLGALYQCIGHVRDDWLYPPPGTRYVQRTQTAHKRTSLLYRRSTSSLS